MKYLVIALSFVLFPLAASAADGEYTLIIKDHKFSPERLEVPAGKQITLIVNNQDATPEEFESNDFNREKVIQGNSTGTILVGPLEAGSYTFFGEFHEETAKGVLVAK